MEGIIETFHIDWKMIVAQAINFGIVVAVFYFFALKPLTKLMAERSERIAKGLEDAKTNKALLEKTDTDYKEALAKARIEAQNIFEAGKKEAEAKKSEMLENARREVEQMLEGGKKSLEAEKSKMINDARNEVAALVVNATEKVLGQKLGSHFDEKAVKEIANL
jgi:F-type H+-transporting ATPase subunit b